NGRLSKPLRPSNRSPARGGPRLLLPCGRIAIHSRAFSPNDRSWKVLPRGPQNSLSACAATKEIAAAKPQLQPAVSVQGAPRFLPSRSPALAPGNGSRLFVALTGRLVHIR